jgi:hypothetical protein
MAIGRGERVELHVGRIQAEPMIDERAVPPRNP